MTYEFLLPILVLIFSVLIVIFRKKVVRDQITFASKRKGFFFKKLANYKPYDLEKLALLSAVGISIIAAIKIAENVGLL